jgi:hypothetical protein
MSQKTRCSDEHDFRDYWRNLLEAEPHQSYPHGRQAPADAAVNGSRYVLPDLVTAYYQVLKNEDTGAGLNFNLSGGKGIELREMLSDIRAR